MEEQVVVSHVSGEWVFWWLSPSFTFVGYIHHRGKHLKRTLHRGSGFASGRSLDRSCGNRCMHPSIRLQLVILFETLSPPPVAG